MKTLVGGADEPNRKHNAYGSYTPKQLPTLSENNKKTRSNHFYMSMSTAKSSKPNWEQKP